MPDDKKKVGKPDRDRVNKNEAYELDVLVKKFPSVPRKKIIELVELAPGQKRDWIERELKKLVK